MSSVYVVEVKYKKFGPWEPETVTVNLRKRDTDALMKYFRAAGVTCRTVRYDRAAPKTRRPK